MHFVGIGGIGMSGIAEVLVNLGYRVSGSDVKSSELTERLTRLGVTVHEGHQPAWVDGADVVVTSSAISAENPEVREARRRQTPVIPRAEMLAELMRLRYGIAVAGAHGKTTTTSMIALVLERAGLDPTAVIGGRLSAFGSNARLGRGDYMVAEADESDGSFLKLSPAVAVITNVDREHLEHYGSFEHLLNAFVEFANRVPFYGAVVLCADDPRLAELRTRMTRRVTTYGLDNPDGDLFLTDIRLEPFRAHGVVIRRTSTGARETLGPIAVAVPGRHNLQNALAAVAVALELEVPFAHVQSALAEFRGAERRFQLVGEVRGISIVDDYGHHPTEIAAVLAAARTSHRGRIVVAFQPHRFSRTRLLLSDFARTLGDADVVVLTDIYPAGEAPIAGVSSAALAELLAARGTDVALAGDLDALVTMLAERARAGDMVITLGAGSIGRVAARLVSALEASAAVAPPRPAAPGSAP